MPYIELNGAQIYYEERGSGPQTIVFAHGLLWSGAMFESQVAHLSARYRCLCFDFRGQGKSEITSAGYDMDSLTRDAAALIQALGCAPCHFAGLSMGGFVGMRLALQYPQLLRSLILMDTTAEPEPAENIGRYRRLNFIARWFGLGLVATPVMKIMFGEKFLRDATRAQERALWQARLVANDRHGITRAVQAVIDRQGIAAGLSALDLPVLIMVGDQDVATRPEKARALNAAIRNSRLVEIAGAGHSATIEEPQAVNAALDEFLAAQS
ncbi:MAG: alpha/beta fold hydrolase [Rhodocyclaceae bacterium]|nr:alpha/beta fold hydrolase [Rhodocyclaceae bacterium]MBX3669686.1 alpha/beta fold hydrolase [Rhodocyclaceae bacterium]